MPTENLPDETTQIGPITMTGPKTFIFKEGFGDDTRIHTYLSPTGEADLTKIDYDDLPIHRPGPYTVEFYDVDLYFMVQTPAGTVKVAYSS